MTLRKWSSQFRTWKMKDPVTGKTKYVPLHKLERKHLAAICQRLIAKAQFQWVMYSFYEMLGGEPFPSDDWWIRRHALLEHLLDEATKRGLELTKMEPTSLKSGPRRWLKALLKEVAYQEIQSALKDWNSEPLAA